MSSDESRPSRLTCGVHLRYTSDLASSIDQLVNFGNFSFVVTPLVHPRLKRDSKGLSAKREIPLTRSDLIFESSTWSNTVVGQVSEWIECDRADPATRQANQKALAEELVWASHLSISAVSIHAPRYDCANYANVVARSINAIPQHPAVWVTVPLTTPQYIEDPTDISADPWQAWNKFRTLCNHSGHLGVMLDITATLPSWSEVQKWKAEPVRAMRIPTKIFLTNSKGYPVLSSAHQELIVLLYKYGSQLVISGRPRHEEGLNPYFLYLQHLINRMPAQSMKDHFEAPFYDYLQSPLQPLNDHLESQMYETFEKDPVKYAKYEEAIALALSETPPSKVSVVMVVGAGRGPLVRASLRAADSTQRRIRMYAVEKNPNAVITLRNMKKMLGWGDTVTVVHTDMRYWDAPEKADILVSELLGSWGDNELSPECLDGAEKFLKEDGISIPYEYTSFVQPIMTPKLWNDCKAFDDIKNMETMYVVKLHSFAAFAGSQPVFTFAHPSWHKGCDKETCQEVFSATSTKPVLLDGKIDNERFRTLEFDSELTGLMHGFGAYFEARLHKDVIISINPDTFSTGMFSWFPIYIPLREPQLISKGDKIRVSFWRQCRTTKVWYEWAMESPQPSPVHNVNGKSSTIYLTTD